MNNKYIVVTRHWDVDIYNNLTAIWNEKWILKWEIIIKNFWEKFKQELFLILSSPKARALETAKNICIWMWIENHEIKVLNWLEEEHDIRKLPSNIKEIKEIIKDYIFIIIVTHWPCLYPISANLWYDWKPRTLKPLESYDFEVN